MNNIKSLKKFLSLTGWRQFWTILNQKEKKTFSVFLFLTIFSTIFLITNYYFENTKIIPAKGGIYIEGMVGFPNFINPIFAPASDVDRDLTKLVFSGLMKYDENNQIIPNLAKDYSVLEGGKVFDFYLRPGLLWSDNKPLTADDVVFTVKAIQNPILNSPVRAMWLDIEIEKISELTVRFKLEKPSPLFLENTVLEIIPKHIWSTIPKENWARVDYNLKPIGSGPYQVESFLQNEYGKIKSLNLITNPNYFGKQPYIPKITFLFFENEMNLIKAFENNQIKGFSLQIIGHQEDFQKQLKDKEFLTYDFIVPRYFALFFNGEKSKILERDKIRSALNYGTNRKEIIDSVLPDKAEIVNSPILPEIFNFQAPTKIQEFNFEKAEKLLIEEGFKEKKDGVRQKVVRGQPEAETLPLRISLSTVNQPLLIKTAEHLKSQWQKLGIDLEIKTFDITYLMTEVIKPRNYEILLFGQSLRAIPDPFPFWHSLQKRDPGLNLVLFENKKADELLEKSRQNINQEERKKILEEFQNILLAENPALFLFNPTFSYFVSSEIKGITNEIIINPSKRFSNIENWHIETKRIWNMEVF